MTPRTIVLATALALAVVQAAYAASVTGRVTDENGVPLAGVSVEVVYQTYNADDLPTNGESIKAGAVTDSEGRYFISTDSLPPGEYTANAFQLVENGGQPISIDFRAEDPSIFNGADDTVRNFTGGYVESTLDNPYGNGGVFVVNNDVGDYTDLSGAEVTLTDVASGRIRVKTVRSTGEGLVVTGIPFGTYKAEVRLAGRPARIRLWAPGAPEEYGDSVTHDFTMGWMGNQFQVAVRP